MKHRMRRRLLAALARSGLAPGRQLRTQDLEPAVQTSPAAAPWPASRGPPATVASSGNPQCARPQARRRRSAGAGKPAPAAAAPRPQGR